MTLDEQRSLASTSRIDAADDGATTRPEVSVADVEALALSVEGARLCALGYHAWTPWLANPNGRSWWTYCARPGCDHQEQFDV